MLKVALANHSSPKMTICGQLFFFVPLSGMVRGKVHIEYYKLISHPLLRRK